MKLKRKATRLIAFLMAFFLLSGELITSTYATTIDGNYSSEVENVSDEETEIVGENDDSVLTDELSDENDTLVNEEADEEENTSVDEISGIEEEAESIDEAEEENTEEIVIEDEEELVQEIEEEEIESAEDDMDNTVAISLTDDNSVHAKILYAYKEALDEADSYVELDNNDEYPVMIFNDEDTLKKYIYVKIIVDKAYELSGDIIVNDSTDIIAKDETLQDVYKIDVTDIDEAKVCVDTDPVIYDASIISNEIEGAVIEYSFATDVSETDGVIDVLGDFNGVTVENSLFVKLPVTIKTENAEAYEVKYISASISDLVKDEPEVIYENEAYRIFKVADAGEISDDVLVSIEASIIEEEVELEEEISEEELDAVRTEEITVSFDKLMVNISARIEAQMILPKSTSVSGGKNYYIYDVPVNKTLTVMSSANEHCKVVGAYIQENAKMTTSKTGEFNIKYSNSLANLVEVVSEAICEPVVIDESNTYLEAVKGSYSVVYDGKYSVGLAYGQPETFMAINDFDLTIGKESYKDIVYTSSNMAIIDFSHIDVSKVAGKTVTLTMKYNDGTKDVSKAVKFIVNYPVTTVGVTGTKWVVDHNEALVPVGNWKSFKVTTNNAGKVDLSKLSVDKKSGSATVYFDRANSTLNILFNPFEDYKTDTVIEFKYAGNRVDNAKNSFVFKPDVSTFAKSSITAKVVSTTDTNINLKLSAPKGFENIAKSYMRYAFKVSAITSAKDPLKSNMVEGYETSVASGAIKDNGIYSLSVVNDYVYPGEGQAQKYKIEVFAYLIDYPGNPINVNGVEAKTKVATITASTQNPYYDIKMNVKKINGSIYQGQQNLLMAEITNSAKTTYREDFKKVSIDIQYKKNGFVPTADIEVDEEALKDGRLIVSASPYAPATKDYTYRVVVMAKSAEATKETTTEFVFKVVPGIGRIDIVNPSEKLYKAYNKAASMKLNVTAYEAYPENEYDIHGYPIKVTPKNVKYEITDDNGYGVDSPNINPVIKEAILKKMITVSNGKVTVAPKFLVDAVEANNMFKVKATATDYLGNNIYEYSDTITLTGVAQTIAEIRWVKAPQDGIISTEADTDYYGKKTIQLAIDNPNPSIGYEGHIKDFVRGYFVALDVDGNIINDVTFKCAQKCDLLNTEYDSLGQKYLRFISLQYTTETYTISAVASNGTGSIKSYKFTAKANPSWMFGFHSLGGRVKDGLDSDDVSTSIVNMDYAPFYIDITVLNGSAFNGAIKVYGGKSMSSSTSKNTRSYLIMPTNEYTIIDVGYSFWGKWYNVWTYYAYNSSWLGDKKVYIDSATNVTHEYISSKIQKPNDNTIFAGYKGGSQLINYTIGGDYSFDEGDKIKLLMDPEIDGIKKASSRKPMNEYLFGFNGYYGVGRDIEIFDNNSFTLSSYYFSDVLSSSTKAGVYSYYAIIFDKDNNVKSMPFKFDVKVETISKTVGNIKNVATVNKATGNEVTFALDSAKANVTDMKIKSIKNVNLNGTPSDFTKFFEIDNGKMVVKAGAPDISGNTNVIGYITYELKTPSGIDTYSKQVTVTVKP